MFCLKELINTLQYMYNFNHNLIKQAVMILVKANNINNNACCYKKENSGWWKSNLKSRYYIFSTVYTTFYFFYNRKYTFLLFCEKGTSDYIELQSPLALPIDATSGFKAQDLIAAITTYCISEHRRRFVIHSYWHRKLFEGREVHSFFQQPAKFEIHCIENSARVIRHD